MIIMINALPSSKRFIREEVCFSEYRKNTIRLKLPGPKKVCTLPIREDVSSEAEAYAEYYRAGYRIVTDRASDRQVTTTSEVVIWTKFWIKTGVFGHGQEVCSLYVYPEFVNLGFRHQRSWQGVPYLEVFHTQEGTILDEVAGDAVFFVRYP
jgi:hypothetical protein